jgi:hypothetical protein
MALAPQQTVFQLQGHANRGARLQRPRQHVYLGGQGVVVGIHAQSSQAHSAGTKRVQKQHH